MADRDRIDGEVVDVRINDGVLYDAEMSSISISSIHRSNRIIDRGIIVHQEVVCLSQRRIPSRSEK